MKINKTKLEVGQLPRYPIKERNAFCMTRAEKTDVPKEERLFHRERIDQIVEGDELVCPTISLNGKAASHYVNKLVDTAKAAYPKLQDKDIKAHVLVSGHDANQVAVFITIPKGK